MSVGEKITSLTEKSHAKAIRDYDAVKEEGFNYNSDQQVAYAFRDVLGLDITNLEGKESTGVEVLQRLTEEGSPHAKQLLSYRKKEKLLSSFFPSYRKYVYNGRIHCSFRLTGTRTGRLSCSAPNLQQQPPFVKELYIPERGDVLITKDFSGIEPVLIGFFSQDKVLCDILIEGRNFHDHNTLVFFPDLGVEESRVKAEFPLQRKVAKELGLLLMYGGGWKRVKISRQKYGLPAGDEECQAAYQNFKEKFRGVFQFKQFLDGALERGEIVCNLMGRPYTLPQSDVYMKGFNTLIQGSASDLLLQSAEDIQAKGLSVRLLVHDEIVVNGRPEDEAIVEREMTKWELNTPYGRLPLVVEGQVADHWAK
jgi:DNA polymerase I-like protein with 3'-5' exonuclease and polymerase domains